VPPATSLIRMDRNSPDDSRLAHNVAHSVNILFLIDELSEMGGAERAFMRLIRDLPARYRARAITFNPEISTHLPFSFPCPLDVIPLERTYDWNALRASQMLRRYISQNSIDIVHTFFETSDLWGGFVAKSVPGIVHISSRRDMGILRSPKHRIAYRYLGRRADRVVTVSDSVRKWCIQADNLSEDKVITVYNGVDDVFPAAAPRAATRGMLGLNTDTTIVTTVGHIRRVKGFDLLVKVAAQLRDRFPNIVFLFAGDVHESAYLIELKQLINALSLNTTVQLLGERDDISSLLSASDVFVLPSRSEGFSNALIEAMMCGLPCVATDVGGNCEAISDGVNGYLVKRDSEECLVDTLNLVLCNPALRTRMGAESRRIFLERFTQAAMIQNMATVYEGALGERR